MAVGSTGCDHLTASLEHCLRFHRPILRLPVALRISASTMRCAATPTAALLALVQETVEIHALLASLLTILVAYPCTIGVPLLVNGNAQQCTVGSACAQTGYTCQLGQNGLYYCCTSSGVINNLACEVSSERLKHKSPCSGLRFSQWLSVCTRRHPANMSSDGTGVSYE